MNDRLASNQERPSAAVIPTPGVGRSADASGSVPHLAASAPAGTVLTPVDPRVDSGQPHLGITPAKLWQGLWYRRWFALSLGIVLAGGGAAVAWLMDTPKFTAAALLRVQPSGTRILQGPGSEEHHSQMTDDYRKSQLYLSKSPRVLHTVLKRDSIRGLSLFHDKGDPAQWLEKELQVGYLKDTGILRIALTAENPEEVAAVVNAVVKEFLQKSVGDDDEQQLRQISEIERVYAGVEEKVRERLERLSKLAEQLQTGDKDALTFKQRLVLEEFGALKRELSAIESECRRTVAQLIYLRHKGKDVESQEVPIKLVSEALEQDPVIQKLVKEANRLEAAKDDYENAAVAGSPRLADFERDLRHAQTKLDKARTERRPLALEKVKSAIMKRTENAELEKEDLLKTLTQQKDILAPEVAELTRIAGAIGKGSFEMEMMRADLDEAKAILAKLRTERERLKIEREVTQHRVRIEHEAEVPQVNQSTLIKTAGTYASGGMMLSFLLVAIFESRFRRVHRASDVRSQLGILTLGVLPLASRSAAKVYGNIENQSASGELTPANLSGGLLAESVDGLRNALLCDDRLHAKPVLLVTSGSQFEGKSFLAAHLAASLARGGRKTLLVDCDLRKSTLHELFSLKGDPGLCDVLRGDVGLAKAIQRVPDTDLAVLPAGKMDPLIVKALNSGPFRDLLSEMRETFDFVVLDSAPTLMVSDTLMIAKQVDAVILVVRPKTSRTPLVLSAFEQLRGLKIPVLGAVINGVSHRSLGGHYHRHYAG